MQYFRLHCNGVVVLTLFLSSLYRFRVSDAWVDCPDRLAWLSRHPFHFVFNLSFSTVTESRLVLYVGPREAEFKPEYLVITLVAFRCGLLLSMYQL